MSTYFLVINTNCQPSAYEQQYITYPCVGMTVSAHHSLFRARAAIRKCYREALYGPIHFAIYESKTWYRGYVPAWKSDGHAYPTLVCEGPVTQGPTKYNLKLKEAHS